MELCGCNSCLHGNVHAKCQCSSYPSLHPLIDLSMTNNPLHVDAEGLPGVIGCSDGTEVTIMRPQRNPEVYFNRKKNYAVNVLLVVDANEKILFYTAGSPGSYHDSRVYRRSNLPNLISTIPRHWHLLGRCT